MTAIKIPVHTDLSKATDQGKETYLPEQSYRQAGMYNQASHRTAGTGLPPELRPKTAKLPKEEGGWENKIGCTLSQNGDRCKPTCLPPPVTLPLNKLT